MRILVSNDDGIDAVGIKLLAEAIAEFGEVIVVAPDRERSGAGHSLTLHRPLRIHKRGDRRYAVDGTPTDCVNLAILELLKKTRPSLVLSGINSGPNLGDDITYSGTVSAAMEGALLGIPSIAISLAVHDGTEPNFAPAAYFARKLVGSAVHQKLSSDIVLNVNVPNINGTKIDDYEITKMGKRHFAGAIAEKLDPRGKKYYWIGGEELGFDDIPGSDCNAVRMKKVSITPIRLDLTDHEYMPKLRQWQL